MPKIFKISGYYVDPNGDYDREDLEVALQENYDLIDHHIKVEERDIGEWDDDHILNRCDCPKDACERYFQKRCSQCGTTLYIKTQQFTKPLLAPLTPAQELRDKLIDMTGEVYLTLPARYCPMCGNELTGGSEK